jgi:hypothetical protein
MDAHAPLHALANAFSKRIENHSCAVALHSMYYNFVRLHRTLKVSPAMAAGVGEAWRWIKNESVVWLSAQRPPLEVASGLSQSFGI